MKALQPWQENKVEILVVKSGVSREKIVAILEAVDWDMMEAIAEILKVKNSAK